MTRPPPCREPAGNHFQGRDLGWSPQGQREIHPKELRAHIIEEALTLAVVTTSGTDDLTVVFVDRDDGVPVPGAADERPIDYMGSSYA